jgi:hypothetical protein
MAHFDDREWQAGRHAAAGLLTRPTAKLRLRTAWSSHWWAVAARWCHLFIEAREFRVEFRYSGAGNWIRASDGKQLRRTRSITKEFKQAPASPDSMRILGEDSPFAPFARIGEGAKSPTISGSETFAVDGHGVECYLIELQPETRELPPGMDPMPTKLWVDKDRFLVLRQMSGWNSRLRG